MKIEKKVRDNILEFNYIDFLTTNKCSNELLSILKIDNQYSILIRVSYSREKEVEDKNSTINILEYKMLGDSFRYNVTSYDDSAKFVKNMFDVLKQRLVFSMNKYDYKDENIITIQFIVYVVGNKSNKIKKFTLKSLYENKDLINYSKISKPINDLIPKLLQNDLGIGLKREVIKDKSNIILLNNNILSLDSTLDDDVKYYQNLNNIYEVIENKDTHCKTIKVFNTEGMFIESATVKEIGINNFIIEIGNVKCFVNNSGIYKKEISKKFNSVYPLKSSSRLNRMMFPDWKFGTLDLETYKIENDLSKVYAIGFYTKDNVVTHYINDCLDSDHLIKDCLNDLFKDKYNGYTFYAHNLANFDIYFIFNIIIKEYIYDFIFKDNDIIGIKLSKKVNKKTITIKIVDSYPLLSSSLEKLCKTFNVDVRKSFFPYDFVNKNNLNYIGVKPDKKYYNITDKEYNNIISQNWSLRYETIKYLENDLISLFQVLDKFIKKIYIDYHIQTTHCLTISSLAMEIFLNRYYENKNIPLIKDNSIFLDVKKSYFGGITEVYKPYGKNLFYYDVNSLYPYSALNVMPGLNCTYIDNINKNISEIENFFGFYYCNIKTNLNSYLGLLPNRVNNTLIMPLGEFNGWYFSEELKFAAENGYEINIIKGYKFNKVKNIFNEYILDLYKNKQEANNEVNRNIYKSLLNHLLGRFGLDIKKFKTILLNIEEFKYIMRTRNFRNPKFINDKILVSTETEISKDICDQYGLDFNQEYIKNVEFKKTKHWLREENHNSVSIVISSAVNSYARIFMNKVKLNILSKGGEIYYTDTDSIVTNIKLEDYMVGDEIGKFKLVYNIKEAFFISNKTYLLVLENGNHIIKSKGVNKDSLTYKDFESLYLGNEVMGIRYETQKSLDKSSATIFIPKDIELSPFSYTKRNKEFNNIGKWIDTSPILITK